MDWSRCILCQQPSVDNLKCPVLSKNKDDLKAYENFLVDLKDYRLAGGVVLDILTPDVCSIEALNNKKGKWHKNCRRNVRKDRIPKSSGATATTSSKLSRRPDSIAHNLQLCLFCKKGYTWNRPLHEFQKLTLTEEVRMKGLALNDQNVIPSVAIGDVVANELKYHLNCLVEFRRRYDMLKDRDQYHLQDTAQRRAFEEVLAMVDEEITAGRTQFSLKELHDEAYNRKKVYGNDAGINRTALKDLVLDRYPILQEQPGFGREIILVTKRAMKDFVTTSLSQNSASDDYQTLAKAALICRREMTRHLNNDRSFCVEKDGFPVGCEEAAVPDSLKFLVGMITHGPSSYNNLEEDQSTISLSQLIFYNTKLKAKKLSSSMETPLSVYIGLFLHSLFRSKKAVNRLAQLGLSIKYERVQYLEHKLSESVLDQFFNEGVLIPTGLRRRLFTVSAVDNIDHNPSSTTCKDSFHGTAISLFQSRNTLNDGDKINLHTPATGYRDLVLPDEYVNIPPLNIRLNYPPQVRSRTHHLTKSILGIEISKEEEWARKTTVKLEDYEEKEDHKATWSAYHGAHGKEVVPSLSGILPLFKQSSNDPAMILHAMRLVIKNVGYLNPEQVPVITGDQPIYAIMKKLQWACPQELGNMVVMLGGFHLEKHALTALGDLLQGSGWSSAISDAEIATSGTADALLKATHVTKSRYSQQVTYIVLTKLLQEAHEQLEVHMPLDRWVISMSTSPTFAFWTIVMKFQAILLTFIRSQRERNFFLYMESMEALGPLFFSLNHNKYARWVPVHIQDLKELPEQTYKAFTEGNFVVRRSAKRFSAIAIDQSHEQMNKILKGTGGVIGLTQNPVSLTKWSLCGPLVSQLIHEFEGYGVEDESESDFFHHDEGKRQQTHFLSDVRHLVDIIRSRGNPFLEDGEDLVNLDGKISMDKNSVLTFEKDGQAQYDNYVKDIIIDRTKSFETPIKRNSFLFFKAPTRPRLQPKKLQLYKGSYSLFSKMYIATSTRRGDLDTFFSHEVHNFPPSIADSEEVAYHSKKSDIVSCLTKEITTNVIQGDPVDQVVTYDCLVEDGGALIHSLVPHSGISTFQNYKDLCFKKHIQAELRNVSSIHIVWDTYRDESIKNETRSSRGEGDRLKVSSTVKIPTKWSTFLKNSKNKVELFQFLGEDANQTSSSSGNVYISSADGKTVKHWGPGDRMDGEFCQEEADTRIVPHILHALKVGYTNILVRSCDSDVVVILIYHFPLFEDISKTACEIIVSYGTGKHRQNLSIRNIVQSLDRKVCRSLPLFVTLTGCDSTSAFKGRSKSLCYKSLKKCCSEVIEALGSFTPFDDLKLEGMLFKSIEQFVIQIYGGGAASINQLRKQLFCQQSKNVEMIPPTQNALYHHCQRALFQASIWVSAQNPTIHEPDPCLHGWKRVEGRLIPLWLTIPQVASVCQELIKCGCRKPCSSACSCKKKKLDCTGLCKCQCKAV